MLSVTQSQRVEDRNGESANELIAAWGRSGYRYGFPDFYAAQFPVRPMYYDQSCIYNGVIGRHYPDAQTGRYHYMFDQNMYLQPGNYDPNPFPTRGFGQTEPASTPPVTQAAVQTPSSGTARAGRVAIGVGITAVLIGAGIFISSRSRRSSHR
jgi:hypothetical protein